MKIRPPRCRVTPLWETRIGGKRPFYDPTDVGSADSAGSFGLNRLPNREVSGRRTRSRYKHVETAKEAQVTDLLPGVDLGANRKKRRRKGNRELLQ